MDGSTSLYVGIEKLMKQPEDISPTRSRNPTYTYQTVCLKPKMSASPSRTFVPGHLIYDGPSPYMNPRGTQTPGRTTVRRGEGQTRRSGGVHSPPSRPVGGVFSLEPPTVAGPSSWMQAPASPGITSRHENTIHQEPASTLENIPNPPPNENTKPNNPKKPKKPKSKGKQKQKEHPQKSTPKRLLSSILSYLPRIFFCCISTRPKYTKIQHLVVPTQQICVDSRALRFLQSLTRQDFLLLSYIVQEVFTDDGVKVLGRISEYDGLIESALRGQIRTTRRPWTSSEREGYVEHTAGLYARLLRRLGVYEKAPMCEKTYGRRFEREERRRSWL
ncbi:hypothetical protein TWF481_000419 [Arthrobotrys musiformis]|uniref:Uncharacterized protein n=1 Tax=Arthrobotrys musiformis TaxID=47236 RepID=A0AAV9WNF8_9PEZI